MNVEYFVKMQRKKYLRKTFVFYLSLFVFYVPDVKSLPLPRFENSAQCITNIVRLAHLILICVIKETSELLRKHFESTVCIHQAHDSHTNKLRLQLMCLLSYLEITVLFSHKLSFTFLITIPRPLCFYMEQIREENESQSSKKSSLFCIPSFGVFFDEHFEFQRDLLQ